DNIFESARQFDTDYVGGSVDTKVCSSEQSTHLYSYVRFVSGNDGGSWFPLRHFTSNVGATQCSNAPMSTREFLFDNLGHPLESVDFYAFAGIDEQGIFANIGG